MLNFDRSHEAGQPIRYYGATECAMALEVYKQRIEQLVASCSFPQPDAYVGDRPAWLAMVIRRWALGRMERKRRRRP